MFIALLIQCRKKAQTEKIHQEFMTEFGTQVRDCVRTSMSSPRDVELIFKADSHIPFVEYAKATSRLEIIKPPIEIMYDDGSFHSLFIDADIVTDDGDPDRSTEYIYLSTHTRVEDDTHKALKLWRNEIKPSSDEFEEKKTRIQIGERHWNDRIEKGRKELKIGYPDSGFPIEDGIVPTRTKVKYTLPQNLNKAKILEIINKLNTSGEVLIPTVIFRSDLPKKQEKKDFVDLYIDYDRSEVKRTLFLDALNAVQSLLDD